jgi:hypothetical protein
MTRKTKYVTVPELPHCDNRDLNKTFLITEWPAARADRWVSRLAFVAMKGGGSLPLDLRGIGWEGVAIIGINTMLRGSIDPDIMIPIGDELLECVQIVPDPKQPSSARAINELAGDIEEVQTRWWLRDQVVSVHVNFSFLDVLSSLVSSILAWHPPTTDSPNTPTSPPA